MSARRSARKLFVAVLLGVLVGGGLMAVTPAGAEVSQAAATNWKKIWKKELKPLAAKTFYTKAQSDTKYASKADSAAAAAAAQSAANASTDTKLGGYYKKTESDAKYASAPTVVRGVFSIRQTSDAAGELMSNPISFGVTLTAAPTVHLIEPGDPVPAGCSGTPASPGAAPGHLCVFASLASNTTSASIYSSSGSANSASPFGAYIGANATAAGASYFYGSWAVGVSTLSNAFVPASPSTGSVDGR